jgi:hypothetical protein
MQREMLFDLESGFKSIVGSWVTRLGSNLPFGYTDIPVFKLTC